jgi:hypothetical protein
LPAALDSSKAFIFSANEVVDVELLNDVRGRTGPLFEEPEFLRSNREGAAAFGGVYRIGGAGGPPEIPMCCIVSSNTLWI